MNLNIGVIMFFIIVFCYTLFRVFVKKEKNEAWIFFPIVIWIVVETLDLYNVINGTILSIIIFFTCILGALLSLIPLIKDYKGFIDKL